MTSTKTLLQTSLQPLTIDDVLSEFAEDRNDVESTDIENEQVDEVESTSLTCPSLAELDEAIEVLSSLSLYSEDRELNPLAWKLEAKLNTRRLQKLRQATIT